MLSNEFIHFQGQIDYIQLDGEQIIERVYTIDQFEEILANVENKIGKKMVNSASRDIIIHVNTSLAYSNDLLRVAVEIFHRKVPVVTGALPEIIKQKIRDRVYSPLDKRVRHIFKEGQIQAFIRDYYSDDIILCQRVLEAKHS